MDFQQVIEELNLLASQKYKENVIKLGIPERQSIGVPTGEVRKLAGKIKINHELAKQLWNSQYHEARLLAVLLFDASQMTLSEIDCMMREVISWDLCDHLCKNLIIKMNDYQKLIPLWVVDDYLYKRRGAFTLIASSSVHEKNLADEVIDEYLKLAKEYSLDERVHVKKAVIWAIKELGKIDFKNNEKAILLCYELKESPNKVQKSIANTALKELENLVKVEGRSRLISNKSSMANK